MPKTYALIVFLLAVTLTFTYLDLQPPAETEAPDLYEYIPPVFYPVPPPTHPEYLTPQPTPQPTIKQGDNNTNMPTNLAIIPTDWLIGSEYTAPTYHDTAELHLNHSSVRMERGDGSKSREIWQRLPGTTTWLPVSIGDRIAYYVYMKTSASSINDTTPLSGVRIGVDFYSATENYITGTSSPDGATWTVEGGYPASIADCYVNWGNDWTRRTIEFVVQDTYPADSSGIGGYSPGELVAPAYVIPWVQVWSATYENQDTGIAWFSDAELYLNEDAIAPAVAFSVLNSMRRR